MAPLQPLATKEIYAIKIIDYTKGNSNDKSNISFNYKSIQQETSLMRLVNKSNYVIKYYGICTTNEIHSGVHHPTISSFLSSYVWGKAAFLTLHFAEEYEALFFQFHFFLLL